MSEQSSDLSLVDAEQAGMSPSETSVSGGVPMEPEGGPGEPNATTGNNLKVKLIVTVVCVVLSLVSALPMANHFASPETYSGLIASLDAKAANVTALTATSTAASLLVSAVPGDAGSPIADKLVDISTDFGVVLAAIYLEKYLLSILGLTSFRILLPAGLIALAAVFWTKPDSSWRHVWGQLAFKFLVFAAAAAVVVPASVWASDLVQQTYQNDIDAANAVVATDVAAEGSSEAADEASSDAEPSEETQDSGVLGWLSDAGSAVAGAAAQAGEAVSSGATELLESAKTALNRLVESLVVMIVTCCVIPILVLVFFAWLCKMVLGINVDLGAGVGALKSGAHRAQGSLKDARQ